MPRPGCGIVEADEAFFLKSAKGSKRLVGRVPRKRGGTAKKKGLSPDEHTPVLIVRDRHGATTDAMLPDLQGATIARVLQPRLVEQLSKLSQLFLRIL